MTTNCSQFPSSSGTLEGFTEYLGNIAGGFGAGMYTWDKNFQSLCQCKSISYDHAVLNRCYAILNNIQELTALCFYSSTNPFIINDNADIAKVCSLFQFLYANVIQFDQEVSSLFVTLYLSYPGPTSSFTAVQFPLDSTMPSQVDCTTITWTVLSNLNKAISYYVSNKSTEIGVRFKDLFGLGTCTALSLNPSSVPAMPSPGSVPLPVAFIVCMVIGCAFFIFAILFTWKQYSAGNSHVLIHDPDVMDNWRTAFVLIFAFFFQSMLGFSIFVLVVLVAFTVPFSLNKYKKKKKAWVESNANSYQQYKLWQGSDLEKMIPNGDSNDFIFSASPVDSFSGLDPTAGSQAYIVSDNEDLVVVQDNRLLIKVGTTQTQFRSRPAVRMAYKEWIQYGVVVLDVQHIPTGPGVWPSFWLNGQPDAGSSWAANGEIDIIEGISSLNTNPIPAGVSPANQTTMHTQKYKNDVDGVDCRQTIDGVDVSCSSGDANGTCGWNKAQGCPYIGCPFQFPIDSKSFGSDFNANGGGVYACRLTKDGAVTVWFWPRGDASMPSDLYAKYPKVNNWKATSMVQFSSCPDHFKNMALVLNTAICGTWAGTQKFFDPLNNCPCNAFCSDPANNDRYQEAYWAINKLAIISMR